MDLFATPHPARVSRLAGCRVWSAPARIINKSVNGQNANKNQTIGNVIVVDSRVDLSRVSCG